MIVIDKTFAADGDSAVFAWQGGEGVMTGVGTFGDGTATLRFSYDGSTYSNVGSDTTITASGGGIFGYLHPCLMKVTLSGSTAPALTVKVAKND
jgi:hypothetical protein